ncbi:antitoxin VbhA family protein [Priestia endophytica]
MTKKGFDIDKGMENVKANFAVEGMEFSKQEEELIKRRKRGEITQDQFAEEVKRLYGPK